MKQVPSTHGETHLRLEQDGVWIIPRPCLSLVRERDSSIASEGQETARIGNQRNSISSANSKQRYSLSSQETVNIHKPLSRTDKPRYSDGNSTTSSASQWSTGSGDSNSLLLTASNLAMLEEGRNRLRKEETDTISIASSTNFTIVNGMEKRRKKPVGCYCERHPLPFVITFMTFVLLLTVLFCIYIAESRAPPSEPHWF